MTAATFKATVKASPDFVVGPVRPRVFGSFVEHLGRCVYTGIYDPEHPTADEDGFRQDVIDLVKEMGVTTVRYPGGNFVSNYQWQDGIGPVEDRPRRLDLAWHCTEPNLVGLGEFMRWCKKADVEPMMAINLGTAGVREALDLLEYCNVPSGTYWSDLRRSHGVEEPYRIKMWCLGNEMDGPWQTGHKTAYEYGRLAAEAGRAMLQLDPSIELVACGSSGSNMPTFGAWENTVLTESYDQVDLISAHAYYWPKEGDMASFMASAVSMDRFIEDVVATADAVRAAEKKTKRIQVSFDEWNVWYLGLDETKNPEGDDWPVAPRLLEDIYNVSDAVVVGNLLMSLLRNTDRVYAASQAQLVNVIAPIFTEPAAEGGRAWRQTTFHPFALTAAHAKGDVLRVTIDSPSIETKEFGEAALLDAVATHNAETGEVTVLAVNRALEDSAELDVNLRGFGELKLVEALTMANDDYTWKATADDATSVLPTANDSAKLDGDTLKVTLPPISWYILRFSA